ncbi:VWA domain-containing protein [Pseudonocardia sp. K10HN5]|uniref:VWA domain-containing protein n=1 Tax=Pseudonocardia acidicola TaxID=2724939 RepID=A0ABX1S447_9PSEU|nr:VWA domain-containing protein [Pseudonocardia acidicola]NMH96338.1 VWA domain-containing protein [Pseudonocardia acidicola]
MPALVARFAAACHDAGLPVGPERAERLARAVVLVAPRTVRRLYWCALATVVSDPAQIPVFDRVFGAVFGGPVDVAESRGDPNAPAPAGGPGRGEPRGGDTRGGGVLHLAPGTAAAAGGVEAPLPAIASAAERLAGRDFDELSPAELLTLSTAMSRLRVAIPPRRSRRTRRASHGPRVDLRSTLRTARRTTGVPITLVRRTPRQRPRLLVVLCDISGSMAPFARALLQLLYCAGGGAGAEVFTFATRLTRLTPVLAPSTPAIALRRAGRLAPDWSGGTRIGEALKEFLDAHGARGMARGAVVLIISDGWETGDPALLRTQMARLSRLAHRIVWANPRTRVPGYRPLVGGMAAAWPYCDAVVSAHSLAAIDDLLAALADTTPNRFSRSTAGGGR